MAEAIPDDEIKFDKFDIKFVHDQFKESILSSKDDVKLKNYLLSYKEINKFFHLMGAVFGFVSSDVTSKVNILNEFLDNPEMKDKFSTIKKMMNYEKSNELLYKKGYVSGSRTLLRLHRGLDFIREFLRRVAELEPHEKTAQCCQEAYDQTLAEFHPWIIKQGVRVAMFTMPTREQLLQRVISQHEAEIQRAIDLLPKMLEVTGEVYTRIEQLYTTMDLHTLP